MCSPSNVFSKVLSVVRTIDVSLIQEYPFQLMVGPKDYECSTSLIILCVLYLYLFGLFPVTPFFWPTRLLILRRLGRIFWWD